MLTRLGRETILVVEDDDEVREVAVWMLTEPGPSNRNHRHEVVLFLPTP
jgi:CheY-like chemotaxis protein